MTNPFFIADSKSIVPRHIHILSFKQSRGNQKQTHNLNWLQFAAL